MAHRFSYELHYGTIQDDICVLHKCDNPPCVNPTHLFLGTKQNNMEDRNNKNRQAKGNKIHTSKLSNEDVLYIKKFPKYRGSGIELSKKFNISSANITNIRNNKMWKHIKTQENT